VCSSDLRWPATRWVPPSPAPCPEPVADRGRTARPRQESRSTHRRSRTVHPAYPAPAPTEHSARFPTDPSPASLLKNRDATPPALERKRTAAHNGFAFLAQQVNPMQTDALSEQFGLFLDVLDTGSFSAAARRHALTPSAIARRIDALERSFGVQLVSRRTQAIRPTTAGLAFAERARRIVHELHLARAEAAALDSTPTGRIRIDAPTPFGRRHLAPALAEFLQAYPGVDIQLRLLDSFGDLHGAHLGEVDLVLRIGPLADTRLVATPLAPMVRVLCASPDYLRRRGMPSAPEELLEHDGLDWDALAPPHAWRFERDGKRQLFR